MRQIVKRGEPMKNVWAIQSLYCSSSHSVLFFPNLPMMPQSSNNHGTTCQW